MAKDYSEDLMKALLTKLYNTVTGNDGNIKIPRNKYLSWMLPGIPFAAEDFLFCCKGLIGDSAEKTRDLYHQAFVLSKLFDFVPDIDPGQVQFVDTKMQQTIFTTTQDTISSVYSDVLKYSRVLNNDISDKEKAKLQKFRDLLSVAKEVVDIVTDEKKTVTEPGPLTLAYTAKMNDYIDAADDYMNLVIEAQSAKGSDPEAVRRVAAFANKSKFLRKKMEAAYMAWVSQGYKNEYETINSYIEQVTQKNLVLYKQDLMNKYKNALLTSPLEGTAGDFYFTTLLPGNFATSPGWTKFIFYEGDYETNYSSETTKWGAAGGLCLGFFNIGAKASGSKTEAHSDQKASNFRAELEFTQIPICRPWFDPGFFSMRAWTLDKIWDLNWDKKVSDGAEQTKPVGRLVAYPTSALFVRNVRFSFGEADSHSKYVNEQIEAGGTVAYGPFMVGGQYSHGSVSGSMKGHYGGGSIGIEGIQLIGLINNIIPKSPNPNPEIKPEQFVGGDDK